MADMTQSEPLDEPHKTDTISFKVTPIERQIIKAASKLSGQTVSDWCRKLVLAAANGDRTLVREDRLDWLREELATTRALHVELLRLIHEHVRHESPTAEMEARARADQAVKRTLERLNGGGGQP